MKQTEFKVGDKVYFPTLSTKVLTLGSNPSSHVYTLSCIGFSFSADGKSFRFTSGEGYSDRTAPCLLHATPENHALLEQLFGVEFEKPRVKPPSKEIILAMLARGDVCVPCFVSDTVEEPDSKCSWSLICSYDGDKPSAYIAKSLTWRYATPFNHLTGEVITELPSDKDTKE